MRGCLLAYCTCLRLSDINSFINRSAADSALTSVPQVLCLLIVAQLLDRYGRRPLLLYSLAMYALAISAFGLSIYIDDRSLRQWTQFGMIVVVRTVFSLGLGPVPAVLAAEVLPNEVRSKGMGVASLTNCRLCRDDSCCCCFVIMQRVPLAHARDL